jgi:hypothetical protein
MGQSLNTYCGLAANYFAAFESAKDALYELSNDEFEDGWDEWETQCFLDALGLALPDWCPNYSAGTTDDMQYQERRDIESANYEAWEQSDEGKAHTSAKDAVSAAIDKLGVQTSYAGAYDQTVPIFYIGERADAYWCEVVEVPTYTVEQISAARVAFAEYARITKLDQLDGEPTVGVLFWGTFG